MRRWSPSLRRCCERWQRQVYDRSISRFARDSETPTSGLYFFLNRAPLALKFLAFFLLSIGLVFLGGAAVTQQRLQVDCLPHGAKYRPTRLLLAQCCATHSPSPYRLAAWLVALQHGPQHRMAREPLCLSGAGLHDIPLSLEGQSGPIISARRIARLRQCVPFVGAGWSKIATVGCYGAHGAGLKILR
jgi:hypothetical protein